MSKAISLSSYLTVGQAARFLGVCPRTLKNWKRAGTLVSGRHPIHGHRLYRCGPLRALLTRAAAGGEERS